MRGARQPAASEARASGSRPEARGPGSAGIGIPPRLGSASLLVWDQHPCWAGFGIPPGLGSASFPGWDQHPF